MCNWPDIPSELSVKRLPELQNKAIADCVQVIVGILELFRWRFLPPPFGNAHAFVHRNVHEDNQGLMVGLSPHILEYLAEIAAGASNAKIG